MDRNFQKQFLIYDLTGYNKLIVTIIIFLINVYNMLIHIFTRRIDIPFIKN